MATHGEVVNFLNKKLRKHAETTNSQWYVGIASDVDQQLFNDHNVDEQKDQWAYWTADTASIARKVEKQFLDAGLDGESGREDDSALTVYVYLKSSTTDP